MEEYTWTSELSLFAKDLFADLMSRHPLLYTLPREQSGSRYFTQAMGKSVMSKWHEIRDILNRKLRNDFPRFTENEDSLKEYLTIFVDVVKQSEHNAINQVFVLSAVCLEIFCFIYRRGIDNFVQDSSDYLFFMLSSVKPDEFIKQGGWKGLASTALKLTDDYNENEICRQYLSANVCNYGTSGLTASRKIDCSFNDLIGTSNEIRMNIFQYVIETISQKEPGHNYEKEQDLTLHETEVRIPNPRRYPNELGKEHLETLSIELSIPDDGEHTTENSKSDEDPGFSKLPRNEIRQIVSRSVQTSEKGSPVIDPSSQRLEISQTASEEFEELTGEKTLACNEPSVRQMNKSSTKNAKDSAKSPVDPKDSHLSELVEDITRNTKYEAPDEAHRFLINEIAANFNLRFVEITDEEVDEFFEKHCLNPGTADSSKHELAGDKTNYIVDTPQIDIEDLTEQKHSDVHDLIQIKAIQPVESEDNCHREPRDENIEKTESTENIPVCVKYLGDPVMQKNLESSSLENKKTSPLRKLSKPPLSEKCSVRDAKSKTSTPKQSGKTTTINDKTPTTSKSASKVRNKAESKTPKQVESDSDEIKPRSPIDLQKTPTDRELFEVQSKSSEKIEKIRRILLTTSAEISKSPRSVSASVADNRSFTKDLPATDSLKHLSPVARSKLDAKDVPSHSKSSTSTTSASVVRHKAGVKDISPVCELTKRRLKSSNPKTESMKEGRVFEKSDSSLTTSTDSSESKAIRSSKDVLNTPFYVEVTHRNTRRHGETKTIKSGPSGSSTRNVNPISTTGRARNVPGKNVSTDPKNEKPRWR